MKVDKIVIVGGGSAGWMSAATMIKSFPDKDITVIESPDYPIVGVGESTIGQINRWVRYIGIDDKDFIPFTDGSFKMNIRFTNFYRHDSGYFDYPFGGPIKEGSNEINDVSVFMLARREGGMSDAHPIQDWHTVRHFYPELPANSLVEYLFPGAQLWNNCKISYNENGEFGNFNFDTNTAYHFDAVKFGLWLKEKYCLPRGVKKIEKTVVEIPTNNQGIEYLLMNDGEKIYADLFIDCTGFKSLLLSEALKEPFISYSDMLPNNRAWAARIPYKDRSIELEPFTNCTAIQNGWCWNIPLWSRLGAGYVYSDKFVSPEDAKEEFKQYLMSKDMVVPRTREEVDSLEIRDIRMRVGIHERTFVKNVVAIGLSAGFIEPLESNGLFSVHEFLFSLSDILQRGYINQFDRDMYNVNIRDLFDGFAKFVAHHYAMSHRDDTEYWRQIQNNCYTDNEGDPYSRNRGKTDSFYTTSKRYFSEWGNTPDVDLAGMTYIGAGMHMFFINEARADEIEFHIGKHNFSNKVHSVKKNWDARLNGWKKAAENALSHEEFLKKYYYDVK